MLKSGFASSQSALKADIQKLQSAAVIKLDEEYAALTLRRKDLSTKNVRDKHYELGSLILGLGVFAAIEGPANTYVRAGKVSDLIAQISLACIASYYSDYE